MEKCRLKLLELDRSGVRNMLVVYDPNIVDCMDKGSVK